MPRVTVLIPVYNDADRLRMCLDALAVQTLPKDQFEVIVVDNGSDEPPAELVASHPFARLATEAKPGSYAARNEGLRQAAGELIAFTDADCLPKPDWLANGIDACQSTGEVVVVGGRVDVFPQDSTAPTTAELMDIAFGFSKVATGRGVTANLMTHAEAFRMVGGFNEELMSGGDHEWCHRAQEAGLPYKYGDEVVVAHPARRTFRERLIKRRRVIGGRVTLSKKRSLRSPSTWLTALRQIFPSVPRTLRGCRRLRQKGYGHYACCKMALAIVFLHYAGLLEAVRVLFGRAAERR